MNREKHYFRFSIILRRLNRNECPPFDAVQPAVRRDSLPVIRDLIKTSEAVKRTIRSRDAAC